MSGAQKPVEQIPDPKRKTEEEEQERAATPVEAAQSEEVSYLPGRCVPASTSSEAPGHSLEAGQKHTRTKERG
jgi:hypothetical protein